MISLLDTNNLVDSVITEDVLTALKKIPDDLVDITITSPPYNKRNKTHGWLVTNEKYSHFDDHMPEEEYQMWQINVLSELLRVTKPGGSVFYNHKLRWVDGILLHPYQWLSKIPWIIRQEIVWDRAIAANMRGWRFWQVDERIYWLYKPENDYYIGKELSSKHAKLSSIWRFRPVPRTENHPAPFPLELPTRIIHSLSDDETKVVLDPFCGTGTTLVAAKLLGHNYLGIDISPDYVDYTLKRLDQSQSEYPIIEQEKLRHVIDDSFAERKKRGKTKWPYGPKPKNGQTE